MAEGADLSEWVGRTETADDFVAPGPLNRLGATLDRDDPSFAPGDPVPPCWHWLLFLPGAAQSALGRDGHPKRGGFLPPIHHLPRRMWAGSRIQFLAPLRVGREVVRRSTVASITPKQGASGPLVFVTLRHEISEAGGPVAIVDEHDIVYRGLETSPAKRAAEPVTAGEWRRSLIPDPVLLFRYSALTFNGHRIHYDRPYVTDEEGYPGLVVHGPLIATLLVDVVRRNRPEARIAQFSFSAVSPVFDGEELSLNGTPPGSDGVVKLWASGPGGRRAMRAEARLEAQR